MVLEGNVLIDDQKSEGIEVFVVSVVTDNGIFYFGSGTEDVDVKICIDSALKREYLSGSSGKLNL